jgi:FkbM family methyltransferase
MSGADEANGALAHARGAGPVRNAPFVSYSGNRDDVILNRLFPKDTGFFVDVGASDPVVGSNTWALYSQGWSGITIEPLPSVYAKCVAQRTRGICLNVAVGEAEGEISLFQFGDGAGHSTCDRARAEALQRELGDQFSEIKVPVRTLGSIFAEYAGGVEIDFVSIDAEGAEASILRSAQLDQFRPKLILIEAMAPFRQVDVSQEASAILDEYNYVLGYEDGLNKFFVAREHSALLDSLRYPPSYFDNYITDSELRLQRKLRRVRRTLQMTRVAWAVTAAVAALLLALKWGAR